MSASYWQHAVVAASALAGETSRALRGAVEVDARLEARWRHVESAETSELRARRVVAERLRAVRARPSAEGATLGARVVASWLRASPPETRSAVASSLTAVELDAVRREADAPLDLARALRWVDFAVRVLGRAPSPSCLGELFSELAGRAPASSVDALRVERSLRVHGRITEARADARGALGGD
ncbi:MAG: hypothetical protein R3A48_12615 [Polyangiales bacterium]